jgi:antitoxin YefM
METLPYSRLRQNLARIMDEVCDNKAPVTVSRRRARSVVLVSLDEYHAMEETIHLLRSPRNAARLLRSIANANAGKLRRHTPPAPPVIR